MKSKTKIWLGVGAFVMAGVNSGNAEVPPLDRLQVAESTSGLAIARALSDTTKLAAAKKKDDGKNGARKAAVRLASAAPKEAGQQGGEAGERGGRRSKAQSMALMPRK